MITLTDVFTFNKPVIVVKRDNHTYYLTDTPQSAIKPSYPVPACEAHNWSDWFSNKDGFWNRPETERLWRLERTLWANGF